MHVIFTCSFTLSTTVTTNLSDSIQIECNWKLLCIFMIYRHHFHLQLWDSHTKSTLVELFKITSINLWYEFLLKFEPKPSPLQSGFSDLHLFQLEEYNESDSGWLPRRGLSLDLHTLGRFRCHVWRRLKQPYGKHDKVESWDLQQQPVGIEVTGQYLCDDLVWRAGSIK